jgi:hypothetical protein
MTTFEGQSITSEIVPTHGTWTREDFCERCRSFDLEDLARGGRIPDCLRPLKHDASSSCPLCQFFAVAVVSIPGVGRVTTEFSSQKPVNKPDLWTLSMILPCGLLQASSWIRGQGDKRFESKYILPLSPGQKTEWPSSAAKRRNLHFLLDEHQPLPFRCLQMNKINMNFMKSCIAGCRRFHSRYCAEPEPKVFSKIRTSLGFKLLDCITRRIIKPPEIFEYIALSYVWGQPLQQRSNGADSLPRAKDELPPVLPETIENAITLTVQLGFQYLWVDKYCIDQSSPPIELRTQLGLMNLIYYGAAVTIIAAAGNDVNWGLPGVGARPRVAQPSIIIDGTTWVSGLWDTDRLIERSVWATRGWVGIYI